MPIGGCTNMLVTKLTRIYFVNDKKATINPKNPSVCFGQNTTTLTAFGTGGKPPYKYLWSNGDTTQSINAGVGKYKVKIYDNSSCPEAADSVTVTSFGQAIIADAGTDQSICKNSNTSNVQLAGTIQQAHGGKWRGGLGTFSPSDTSLNAIYHPSNSEINNGQVTLSLLSTGNGSCPADSSEVTIYFREQPIVNILGNGICLAGTTTKTVALLPGESAKWFDNVLLGSNSTIVLSPMVSTIYKLEVTNAFNCIKSDTFEIKVFTPNTLTQADTSICESASFSMSPKLSQTGSDQLLYAWTQNNVAIANTSATVSGTDANTYSLTYGNWCKNTLNFKVNTFPISIEAGPTQTICANASNPSVSLAATAQNSNGQTWFAGKGIFSAANALNTAYAINPTEIVEGDSIKLYVKSAGNLGCKVATDSVYVKFLKTPQVNITDKVICKAATTTLVANTGEVALKYEWKHNATTITDSILVLNNVVANQTVSLTITSPYNCKNTKQMTISVFDKPIVAINDTIVCAQTQLKIIPHLTNDPFFNLGKYTWAIKDSIIDVSSFIITTFSATYQLVYGIDECVAKDTAHVLFIKKDVLGIQEKPICLNDKSVELKVNNYFQSAVKWYGGSGYFSPNDTIQKTTYHFSGSENKTMAPLAIYVKSLSSKVSCSSNIDTIWVTPNPLPQATISQDTVCEGLPTILTADFKTKQYFSWQVMNKAYAVNPVNTLAINGGSVNLSVQDSITGCVDIITTKLFGVQPPQIQIITPILCKGTDAIIQTQLTINDELVGLGKYKWFKEGKEIATAAELKTNTDGVYKVVFSIGSCVATNEMNFEFKDAPFLELGPPLIYCKEMDKSILISAKEGYDKYIWEDNDSFTTSSFLAYDPKIYRLTVFNQYNCAATDSVEVLDICPPVLEVPNAFTPGGNNNNMFTLYSKFTHNFRMLIFNRWGEIIFESKDPGVFWDGIYLGDYMVNGVYPWIITYEGLIDKYKGPFTKKGFVTVIR